MFQPLALLVSSGTGVPSTLIVALFSCLRSTLIGVPPVVVRSNVQLLTPASACESCVTSMVESEALGWNGLLAPAAVPYVPTVAVGPRVVGWPDAVRSVFHGMTPWH